MPLNICLPSQTPIKRIHITRDVSTNCEAMVEPLFLSHRCLPLVNFFQKWKILTSINCAIKYATIDAAIILHALRNTAL